jgi:hypothetical protein
MAKINSNQYDSDMSESDNDILDTDSDSSEIFVLPIYDKQ